MTDEELIRGLRQNAWGYTVHDAADRIEQLLESIKNLSHLWATAAVNRKVSDGKLDKAVATLQFYVDTKRSARAALDAVLAELEEKE